MDNHRKHPVIVGVDGSRDGLTALAWSVDHAVRSRAPIRVVHVVDDSIPPGHLSPATLRMLDATDGSEILQDAATEFRRLGRGAVSASFEIQHGHPAEVLLDLAAPAALLVVGRRGLEGFAELIVGSTSQVCAALSDAPVVVVPDCWPPGAPSTRRVIVGVDGTASCQPALDFAFGIASMRGASLTVVHAARMPELYPPPDLWLSADQPPWSPDVEHLVAESLAGWAEKFPDVAVETRLVAGHPVEILAAASATADLVVVGGVSRARFSALRLGSVSRGLLHHAACPVAVVHERRA